MLPPAGLNLFIAAFRFNRPITELYRAVIPFILLMVVALLLVTYIPKLVVVPKRPARQINQGGGHRARRACWRVTRSPAIIGPSCCPDPRGCPPRQW